MKTNRALLILIPVLLVPILLLSTCNIGEIQEPPSEGPEPDAVRTLRILATSDLHNYFLPWDYDTNTPHESGSLSQAASVVRERRNLSETILLDCGDSFQGNGGQRFLSGDPEPMITAMNALQYDLIVAGDHEFDYGPERVQRLSASLNAPLLAANVYGPDGNPLTQRYTILERAGIRIGVIGLVTPVLRNREAFYASGCRVTNPAEEARKIIDEIRDECDLLIAAVHMGDSPEEDLPGSCLGDVAAACPELDLILSSQLHGQPESPNDPVLPYAGTLSEIILTAVRDKNGWSVNGIRRETVELSAYGSDPELEELLSSSDALAREWDWNLPA